MCAEGGEVGCVDHMEVEQKATEPPTLHLPAALPAAHPAQPTASDEASNLDHMEEEQEEATAEEPPTVDLPAALPAAHSAQSSTSVQPTAAPSAGKSPLVGGALKCCGCGRWHNVPDKVMNEVRCSVGVL
jgi:hypothetical protein